MEKINQAKDLSIDKENVVTLTLDSVACKHLIMGAKWARFISILSFIGLFFMVVCGFFYKDYLMLMAQIQGGVSVLEDIPSTRWIFFVLFLIIAIIYFFPTFFLYRFSTDILKGFTKGDTDLFSKATRYFKYHYVYIGIMILIIIFIYLLAAISMVILYFSYTNLYL